ncbi:MULTISPECIES: riboflavin synthase [Corynebacterium]|uniref:Riboflavin synthase n=1 Tax=Corynebacterium freneyi TaxID=134034 RepID=A0ABS4U7B9_9CORY|nr:MULTISPECIES: riboflavin synthase [Corynebacterium]MBP2332550.1 riboflavin synthase [Corynebacterium freneyi]MCG7438017.1 riboflavin synthase [Corynebacterium freneyi]OFU53563.1 riboflavin synthase subunit alpha [Corynebacterium sp. HMSC11E11]QXA53281.1 riboflavin synthase [Corynebacterium freneyi]UBI01258.1 riboflavin synthase [Corynebacterium freneyi]
MFTGIVEELGRVAAIEDQGDAIRLTIGCTTAVSDAKLGDSIAVNGVCLTVAEFDETGFTADVMQESLDRTSLGGLAVGSPVNLERAVAAGARLGGHIVQGHVDGTGAIVSRTPGEHWEVVRISLPDDLDRYVVEKGSIAVDGTSLTVSALGGDAGARWFEVSLIPTTLADTVLGTLDAGATVNLEVDAVAKYIEKLLPR